MVALMAVSGSMFAQGTTEPKGEVIDFVATFSKIEKADNTDKNGHEFVYLEKHAIEQNGISVVFAKATGSSAPSFKIKDAKTGNADKFIKLFGGALSGENKGTDGNTMTFKAEKNITKISIAASNADQYGTIKANCGTVEMTGAETLRPRSMSTYVMVQLLYSQLMAPLLASTTSQLLRLRTVFVTTSLVSV